MTRACTKCMVDATVSVFRVAPGTLQLSRKSDPVPRHSAAQSCSTPRSPPVWTNHRFKFWSASLGNQWNISSTALWLKNWCSPQASIERKRLAAVHALDDWCAVHVAQVAQVWVFWFYQSLHRAKSTRRQGGIRYYLSININIYRDVIA